MSKKNRPWIHHHPAVFFRVRFGEDCLSTMQLRSHFGPFDIYWTKRTLKKTAGW